jgi:hypothetical protein
MRPTEARKMSPFLTLSGSLEGQYWASGDTHRQIQLGDVLGLFMGVLLNSACISYVPKRLTKCYFGLAAILQSLQLVWSIVAPHSYMRQRFLVSWLQRARVMVIASIAISIAPSDRFFSTLSHTWLLETSEGRFRAFMAIVFSWSFIALLMGLNHALPFKSQALVTAWTFLIHSFVWVQHQERAMHRYHMESWVQSTCQVMEAVFWGPFLIHGGNLLGHACNGPHVTLLVVSQGFAMLGCHTHVLLVYWLEYVSKASFLQAEGLPGPPARMPWLLMAISLWSVCSLSWTLLLLLHGHLHVTSLYTVPLHSPGTALQPAP